MLSPRPADQSTYTLQCVETRDDTAKSINQFLEDMKQYEPGITIHHSLSQDLGPEGEHDGWAIEEQKEDEPQTEPSAKTVQVRSA